MEFFDKIFDWLAGLSAKVPSFDFGGYFIAVLIALALLGIVIGFTYLGTSAYKLRRASLKILKYLNDEDSINDDNLGDFTAQCFSSSAPRMLRESWVKYLGVRFGYPSDIVTEAEVFDKEVKKAGNLRANIFIGAALIMLAVSAFIGFGSISGYGMSVVHCTGLLLSGAVYLILAIIGKSQFKKAKQAFNDMQDELDAKVDFQVENNYSTETSPLVELSAIVDGIIAKNTAKFVEIADEMNETESVAPHMEEAPPETPIEALCEEDENTDELESVDSAYAEEEEEITEEEQARVKVVPEEIETAEFSEALSEEPEENAEEKISEEPEENAEEEISEEPEETEEALEENVEEPSEEIEDTIEEEQPEEETVEEETEAEEEEVSEDVEASVEETEEITEEAPVEETVEEEPKAEEETLPEAEEEELSEEHEEPAEEEQAAAQENDEVSAAQEEFFEEQDDADRSMPVEIGEEEQSSGEDVSGEEIENQSEDESEMFGRKKHVEPAVAEEPVKNVDDEFVEGELIDDYYDSEILDEAEEPAAEQPVTEESVDTAEEPTAETVEESEAPEEETDAEPAEEESVEEAEPAEEGPVEEEASEELEEEAEFSEEEASEPAAEEEAEPEVVYVVDEEEEDETAIKPPKLAKLPHILDYMLTMNISKSNKIKLATLLLSAYNFYKKDPANKEIVLQCLFKIMGNLQNRN